MTKTLAWIPQFSPVSLCLLDFRFDAISQLAGFDALQAFLTTYGCVISYHLEVIQSLAREQVDLLSLKAVKLLIW